MRIQIFIFCWNDYVEKTMEMENQLKKFGNVIVINSNELKKKNGWINLNNAFFAEQWNALINYVDLTTDFVMHIQSDATIVDYERLIESFNKNVYKYDVGVYAPNIEYTWHTYDTNLLNKIDLDLFEVPNTDCTCWFINTCLFDKKPLYNITTNYIGYGADWYYIAKSRLRKKLVVRDYSIKVLHPNFKGYNAEEGNKLFDIWLKEQNSNIRIEIQKLFDEVKRTNLNYLS